MREVMSMREGGGTQIRWRRDGGRVESPNLGRRGGGHWEERRLRPHFPSWPSTRHLQAWSKSFQDVRATSINPSPGGRGSDSTSSLL